MHSSSPRLASLVVAAAALVVFCRPAAFAQTEGRIGVGGSVTFVSPVDDEVANTVGVGPLVRLNPKRGWRPAAALNWFRADLENPAGGDSPFARLRVRPLMGGVGYTIGPEKTLVTFSIVAGPSFNSVDFEDEFLRSQGGSPAIDVDNSFVVRPGVSVTQSVAPRVGIVGFAGFMFNRPNVRYRSGSGAEFEDRWKADSIVLSVGLVYSLF
jgi:hypothetical protein